ncbi:hypothetical protein [Lysobacter enzymogenes]|uniref:hypothetical protein n=1 Tax=Lysobacter enzymogenes TaxID=69 RepID=UPI001AF9DE1A|nr:hypothetical protein [Lysobacter enzymogenes]QQQ00066.1 hypothetical protein JHW41_18430 [Lysobacter enzymogenes]
MIRSLTASLLLAGAAASMPAAAGERVDGSFVFMSADSCYTAGNEGCYLTDPAAATKAVDELAAVGVKHFLLPGTHPQRDTLAQLRVIARAVKDRGFDFYTYEGWSWKSKRAPGGAPDCAAYTAARIDPALAPLRVEFGAAFAGLHYQDEPAEDDPAALGRQTDCVKADPRLQGLKIFVNVLPLHANDASYGGTDIIHFGSRKPEEFGVDCAAGAIANQATVDAMVTRYSNYARNILDQSRADYLAMNLYPFVPALSQCPRATQLLMSENMSIIANLARSRGRTSVAYLQNVHTATPALHPQPFELTGFGELRWYATWFYAFGGDAVANFASHTHPFQSDAQTGWQTAILGYDNRPTALAEHALNGNSYAALLQRHLGAYAYRGFVDNALGPPSGELVGWISNHQVLAGEYGRGGDAQALVVFARRAAKTGGGATIGLQRWYGKVEKLDLWTGAWTTVGTATNRIDVSLDADPGALYRLTR